MDGTIHSSTPREPRIGRVDDGIRFDARDIAPFKAQRFTSRRDPLDGPRHGLGGSTGGGVGELAGGPAVLGPRPSPISEGAVILPVAVSFWSVWN